MCKNTAVRSTVMKLEALYLLQCSVLRSASQCPYGQSACLSAPLGSCINGGMAIDMVMEDVQ